MLKASRFCTGWYAVNIVSFQFRSALAAMQVKWSSFLQNLCYFHIALSAELISKFQFSQVLAAV